MCSGQGRLNLYSRKSGSNFSALSTKSRVRPEPLRGLVAASVKMIVMKQLTVIVIVETLSALFESSDCSFKIRPLGGAALPINFHELTFAGIYRHFDKSELSKSAPRFSTMVTTVSCLITVVLSRRS